MEKKQKPYIVGVDLGGTNVRAAVTDGSGKILGEAREPSYAMEGLSITVGQITFAVRSCIDAAGIKISQVAGVGMGVPGWHDAKQGVVNWSPNFRDWNGVQLLEPIRVVLGLPVFMENDGNVAALGEFKFGAGKDIRSLIMMTLGTGVGGGIILDGKLWTGTNNAAGEIGHSVVLPDGPKCGCGRNGCLESLAKRDAVIDRAARKIQLGRKSSLINDSDWPNWDVTPATIAEAAQQGDEVALETMAETAYYIGIGVANAINILNPDIVAIGGGISQAGAPLWEPLQRTVHALALVQSRNACKVVPTELGDDAGILGGVTLVMQELGY